MMSSRNGLLGKRNKMKKVIATFQVEYLQILDEQGKIDESLFNELGLKDDNIKHMYKLMILSKKFDDAALALQREGRLGTYASARGQEASQIGSILALRKEDFVFPAFREIPAYIARGMPMHMLLQYWGGDERGENVPKDINMFTVSIPVGSQPPQAVGYAWAAKLRKKNIATLVYFGDGATSEGDFHEAMNFAGVFKVPCIFFCQNNQYAISLSREKQTASKTIAQKAIAYGFLGIQVDGNDIFAVYKATKDALNKALKGEGPTLIEAYTYRLQDHTTADDASRYREQEEVEEWKKKDPIDRLRKFMKGKGIWSEEYEKGLLQEVEKKVKEAVDKYVSMPEANYEDIFKYTFAEMPWNLKEQLEEFKGILEGKSPQKTEEKEEVGEEEQEDIEDVEIEQVKPD